MRIALVTPGFGANDADWCVPVVTEWARAAARTHDVVVFAVQHPGRGRWRAHGVEVISVGRRGPASGLRAVRHVVAAVREAHARAPFDAICAMWAEESGLAAVLAGRELGVPVSVTLLGVEMAGPREIPGRARWRRVLARAVCNAADRVLAPSSWIADRLSRPVEVVPLGVDRARFAASGPRPGARLLSVGSLLPVKGHDALIRAFAEIRRAVPAASLEIVGEGPLRGPLAALAADLGVPVRLRGAVPYERMPGIYASADLLVQASRWEAQGMAVVEALACGLPVVSTPVGLAGDWGDVVRLSPADRLARTVIDALADSAWRARIGASGPRIVEERATWAGIDRWIATAAPTAR